MAMAGAKTFQISPPASSASRIESDLVLSCARSLSALAGWRAIALFHFSESRCCTLISPCSISPVTRLLEAKLKKCNLFRRVLEQVRIALDNCLQCRLPEAEVKLLPKFLEAGNSFADLSDKTTESQLAELFNDWFSVFTAPEDLSVGGELLKLFG